ncbi:hypothetical protein IHE55_28400 [Streptomyces pactum]|uniref:Beta-ketoacyl synthase C-terminal domain-containing protein n=1 Tax=Streptomyces pactum TaxID=68249 RepID=A0ABS0NTF5_9ACTN|nr:hypothetical protein [Streptomyces pactum]MBH5338497.1 hypothetical protein [Streptomyces pactum]
MSWVVSGTGAVSAVGADPGEMFAELCDGHSGVRKFCGFDRTPFGGRYAYQMDDHPGGRDVPGRASALLARAAAGVPLMTAIKSMTGHNGGASGVMSVISAVRSMRHGVVPPVAGLTEPLAEAEGFRLVTGAAAREPVTIAQVDAPGFGGMNAVAVPEAAR